jgi:hypothetical protein
MTQPAALSLAAMIGLTSLADAPLPSSFIPPIPILEVIKVYGKLAGQECYDQKAPKGSSCQVTSQGIERALDFDDKNTVLTEDEFRERLNRAQFQWPLKPYGVDKSLSKTATMNKGAETRIFMDQLEERGLYDKRNPTGPLPTSLRPQLNRLLQEEGINPRTSDRVFQTLGGKHGKLAVEAVEQMFENRMDFYGFLDLLGKDSITWPY